MQPSQSVPDLAGLQQAWEAFTGSGQCLPGIDPLIVSSWQRCALRLNPTAAPQWVYLSDEVLRLLLKQHNALRTIARPILEDLHQFIEGAGAGLVLLDSTLCVLDLLGDPGAVETLNGLGIRPGAYLDDSRVGTTAFSVALVEGCAAQVVGPEHFLQCFHGLSTYAAPLYDLEGHPLGVVGLSTTVAGHSAHALGIAVAAARAIENQLQAELFVGEANTRATEVNTVMDAISEGVLAWTAQGVVTHLNDPAGQLLGLTPAAVVGRPLAEFVSLPEGLVQALARDEELKDVETSFHVQGVTRECLLSLHVVRTPEGAQGTVIATLRPLEQVRRLLNRLMGTQARLTLDDIGGQGPAARRMRRQALAAAGALACVLLVGEAGTGKTVLARAIHNSGRRAGGPFLTINCRAIPRELVLGEFLGFEAGAFNSGSATGQPSKFELAHSGTLFLQEIDALPLDMQAALLRVIEGGDVIRLGGTRVIPVDVRLIASSAADLEAGVAEGSFRADLLFRLSSFHITTVPLRERPEDIPLLIERLLEKLGAQVGKAMLLAPAARAALGHYPWPGNIRELESVLERSVLLCEGQAIALEHLPESVRRRRAIVPRKPLTEPVRSLAEAEQVAILSAGRAARGNLSQAAQLLGIGRTTLWRKMKALGLSVEDFQGARP